jgi:hypothetical protein
MLIYLSAKMHKKVKPEKRVLTQGPLRKYEIRIDWSKVHFVSKVRWYFWNLQYSTLNSVYVNVWED